MEENKSRINIFVVKDVRTIEYNVEEGDVVKTYRARVNGAWIDKYCVQESPMYYECSDELLGKLKSRRLVSKHEKIKVL